MLCLLFLPAVARAAEQFQRLDNAILHAGLDPSDRRLLRLVDYFGEHGIRLVYHPGERDWRVLGRAWHGAVVGVSLRTFPEWASREQMQAAVGTINLAYLLNPDAHIAMSLLLRHGRIDVRDAARMNELDVCMRQLFLAYDPTLPEPPGPRATRRAR